MRLFGELEYRWLWIFVTVSLISFFYAILVQLLPAGSEHFNDLDAFLYISVIIGWAFSIRHRIVQQETRRLLTAASSLMVLFFVIRICRLTLFAYSPRLDEHAWYAYYIPMTGLPMTAFLTALRVDTADRPTEGYLRIRQVLVVCEMVLCALVMTNSFHQKIFIIISIEAGKYMYTWLYLVLVIWSAGLGFGAFLILYQRCRVPAVQKLWYIPLGYILAGVLLLVVYLVSGGNPSLFGIRLYRLQEAYCFLYITGFESMIRIGLIRSNSGYDELFRQSHIRAEIIDDSGRTVFRTAYPEKAEAAGEDKDRRIHVRPISGGRVLWEEELGTIHRLNEALRRATEDLADENDLIRHENAVLEERIRYQTKNRLYNKISSSVRKQLDEIRSILDREEPDIGYTLILGAYIKRMGNLMLIVDERQMISSGELALSIRESIEYLSLYGKTCDLTEDGEAELPGGLILTAYELFETVMEQSLERIQTCDARIRAAEDKGKEFGLIMYLDTPEPPELDSWNKDRLQALGAGLSVNISDDTSCIRLFWKEASA